MRACEGTSRITPSGPVQAELLLVDRYKPNYSFWTGTSLMTLRGPVQAVLLLVDRYTPNYS